MTLPTLNLTLLTDMIEWAEVSHKFYWAREISPEDAAKFRGWGLWDQDTYGRRDDNACGTALCQAGQAAVQTGWKLSFHGDAETTTWCERGKGSRCKVASIPEVAQEALGFTGGEADLYFEADNDIDDLKSLVNRFCKKRGLPAVYDEHGNRVDVGALMTAEIEANPEEKQELRESKAQVERGEVRWLNEVGV